MEEMATVKSIASSDKEDELFEERSRRKTDKLLITNRTITNTNNHKESLTLANALYFKGTWAEPFLPVRSVTKSFYTLDGNMVQVPYLTEYSLVYSYGSSQGCKILTLPYKVGNQKELSFSISFFLPDEKDGLPDLLKRLSSDSALLKFKFNQVRMRKIRIPKFKLEYNMEVSDMMEQMGLRLNLKKDSEMLEDTDPNTVEDMKVCHSCCVEVGENGCEPLAVQTFDTSTRDVPPHTVFIADHPFMFMIREDSSETPIFLGAVVNPLLQ
ncbi:serpin-Z2B-like [Humulus lupulus]|uniref:serpin-Z2B-like n=1 Tax=Humulus lupulus TaxID=3486 RepID=UPI002B412EBD|nr:serpin-Z2B-like [Humulus lupulus]